MTASTMSLLYVCFYAGRVPRDLSQQNTRATRAGVLAQVSAASAAVPADTVRIARTVLHPSADLALAQLAAPVQAAPKPPVPAGPSGESSLFGLSS
ncbi:hypothetical protein ACEE90_05745 [Corynebacterium phoceense]|uniref:hypothetical protein n=1 Tax=Corynebacterium phoceense TaxID=1686286 RepID=UPI00211BFC4D|nr:hypothetical protein [Corynebacterium phoceense]MCQ9333528.1 hypothetical protein [Corynebacterium phoceense]